MFIMATLGGTLIWKHGKSVAWEGEAKTVSLLSLCISVPMALSVPDSLWFKKSLSTALTHPRIYLAMAVVAGVGAYQVNPKVAQRVNLPVAALDFSYQSLNTVSSLRVQAWSNAANVLEHYPINGAGVRSFRYAYPKFAAKGDPFISLGALT